jgi:hypothetical protein
VQRGDVRRKLFALRVSGFQNLADRVPVVFQQRAAKAYSRVADAFENLKDFPVAVDVAFGDLPVVDTGVARLARVDDDDAASPMC